MYKLITFKKIKHLKQISYNEFSKFHEAFMWAFNIFQEFVGVLIPSLRNYELSFVCRVISPLETVCTTSGLI
jgi:hypothetical protein